MSDPSNGCTAEAARPEVPPECHVLNKLSPQAPKHSASRAKTAVPLLQ